MKRQSHRSLACLMFAGFSFLHLGCGSETQEPADLTSDPVKHEANQNPAPSSDKSTIVIEPTTTPKLSPEDYRISIEPTVSAGAVGVLIETNIPGVVDVMVSVDLKGQAPDDTYIGTSKRIQLVDGTATHQFDTSDLPTGDYQAEVAFYPRWGFQDEVSRSTGIARELKAAKDIRLGGSGESASAVQFRENSQSWVMGNVGPGDPWQEKEWTGRFGGYEELRVEGLNPDVIKALYFPKIDMTIFVNSLKSTISHWRTGRANR